MMCVNKLDLIIPYCVNVLRHHIIHYKCCFIHKFKLDLQSYITKEREG